MHIFSGMESALHFIMDFLIYIINFESHQSVIYQLWNKHSLTVICDAMMPIWLQSRVMILSFFTKIIRRKIAAGETRVYLWIQI